LAKEKAVKLKKDIAQRIKEFLNIEGKDKFINFEYANTETK
jgi:hypothetical protein